MPTTPAKHAKYLRDRYNNDPVYRAEHKRLVSQRKKRYKEEIRKLFQSLKLSCKLCPETAYCCLSFHHVDKDKKEFTIAYAIARQFSRERVLAEIAKCVVLCENCHRKVHAGLLSLKQGSSNCGSSAS